MYNIIKGGDFMLGDFSFLETGADIRDKNAVYTGDEPAFARNMNITKEMYEKRDMIDEEFGRLLMEESLSDTVSARYPYLSTDEDIREHNKDDIKEKINASVYDLSFLEYGFDIRSTDEEIKQRQEFRHIMGMERGYEDMPDQIVDSIMYLMRLYNYNPDKFYEKKKEKEREYVAQKMREKEKVLERK